MQDLLYKIAYVWLAKEHRATRWMLALSAAMTGWYMVGLAQGLGVRF
jgi:hypothetical protein